MLEDIDGSLSTTEFARTIGLPLLEPAFGTGTQWNWGMEQQHKAEAHRDLRSETIEGGSTIQS